MNCATNLERSAFFFPKQPAASEGGIEITYARLNEKANRIATALFKIGIKPGDFVGLCAPNSSEWLAFYFGVIKAGAVAVTLSSLLTSYELNLLMNHSNPKIVFTFEERLGDFEKMKASGTVEKVICRNGDMSLGQLIEMGSASFKAVDRDRSDTAAVLYTGGTTGIPKGVMLSHENINTSAYNVSYSEHSTSADRALCFLPFNHVFGQMHIMNATIRSAGCLELLPSFDMDRFLAVTESGQVTKLFAVPTVYARLLTISDLKKRLGNVRYSFSAAASMAVEIVQQWKEQTGLTINEGYGLTETASAVTYNHIYRHVIGSIGECVSGVEVQIRDERGHLLEQGQEGEICIKGNNVMTGYLNNPEATEEAFWENGWFRSGDIGRFDENDYLYIVDRLKDMIITGGENVYPREVEEVIYARPEVELCAVVGLPDKEWGERVTAFIVPKPGKKVVTEDLKKFLKSSLSFFKVPKEYILVDDMPKSSSGKILKRELKKMYENRTRSHLTGIVFS
jgi:long-chain acyl-CoA synthetase